MHLSNVSLYGKEVSSEILSFLTCMEVDGSGFLDLWDEGQSLCTVVRVISDSSDLWVSRVYHKRINSCTERERKKNEYLRKQALSQDGNNLYDQISKIVQLFFNNTKVFKENFDERNIMLVIPQCIYTYCLWIYAPKQRGIEWFVNNFTQFIIRKELCLKGLIGVKYGRLIWHGNQTWTVDSLFQASTGTMFNGFLGFFVSNRKNFKSQAFYFWCYFINYQKNKSEISQFITDTFRDFCEY